MHDYQFLKIRGSLSETTREMVGVPVLPYPLEQLGFVLVGPEVVALVPEAAARNHVVMPLAFDGETITIAAVDGDDIALADKLRFLLAKNVRLVTAPRAAIWAAIQRNYEAGTANPVLCPACGRSFTIGRDLEGTPVRCPSCGKSFTARRTDAVAKARAATATGGTLAMLADVAPASKGGSRGGYLGQRLAEVRKGVLGVEDEDYDLALGVDPTAPVGGQGMWFYTVEEGQRVLLSRLNGTMEIMVGPRRVWRGWNTFRPMQHYVAHPDEFLIVRFRDGRQEHLPGPSEVWFDPREHLQITKENALQIAAKEAVVVYSRAEDSTVITRRVVYGPALFVPRPGEWLHTFSWHASRGGSKGVQKEPNALVFQKLWLMPDQMYHDVTDVRTADDAVLTIRLMIFFELVDIDRMLDATHDPIGDFVNAATSDVVAFTCRHDFEAFKHNTGALNELATYQQLLSRAVQCGYRINKVVYRGYGAAEALQQMHDQAIEARTRLQLDRATEQQAQDLENYKLDCQLGRAGKRRTEQIQEVEHDLALARTRQEAELRQREAMLASQRESQRLEAELQLAIRRGQDDEQRGHLDALRALGVDLTAFLTQARADQIIEFRGESRPHVHLDGLARANGNASAPG